jgi:hypothetical protein
MTTDTWDDSWDLTDEEAEADPDRFDVEEAKLRTRDYEARC